MTSRADTMNTLRPLVAERASGLCENNAGPCWSAPSELHHVLPRSRASKGDVHLLDAWATDEITAGRDTGLPWLAFLCVDCHRKAHDEPEWARAHGLMVDGTVSAKSGRPVYRGTDKVITAMFGEVPA